MGFWYFLILFVGIALIVVGMLNKDVSRSVKNCKYVAPSGTKSAEFP
jgi:hypothetical protein